MTTETDLLAAVIAAPLDDGPRLVMADWFEEHGAPERAEFIRVQIELADSTDEPCGECGIRGLPYSQFTRGCEGRMCTLKCREFESSGNFIVQVWHAGSPELATYFRPDDWSRGFPHSICISMTNFLHHAKAIAEHYPIARVNIAQLLYQKSADGRYQIAANDAYDQRIARRAYDVYLRNGLELDEAYSRACVDHMRNLANLRPLWPSREEFRGVNWISFMSVPRAI